MPSSVGSYRLHTRKFMTNRLLQRKQMVVDVYHHNLPNVRKSEIQSELAKRYNCDPKAVMLFGFRTVFGGGKSTGFALVYDSVDALMKFERKYRQARFGLIEHKRMARKRIKETKNRCKKFRGKKKAEVFASAKK